MSHGHLLDHEINSALENVCSVLAYNAAGGAARIAAGQKNAQSVTAPVKTAPSTPIKRMPELQGDWAMSELKR